MDNTTSPNIQPVPLAGDNPPGQVPASSGAAPMTTPTPTPTTTPTPTPVQGAATSMPQAQTPGTIQDPGTGQIQGGVAPRPSQELPPLAGTASTSTLPPLESGAGGEDQPGGATVDPFNTPLPRKRSMFIPCCIALFIAIILAIGGLGYYVYTSGSDIPIVSDIVDMISGLIKDPKKEAQNASEQVASTLIATIMPMIIEDESLVSSLTNSSLSKEYINNMMDDYEEVKSLRYDLEAKVEVETSGEDTSLSTSEYGLLTNLDLSMKGAFDMKEEGNEKWETDLKVGLGYETQDLNFEGELKALGEKAYMKIDVYPSMYQSYVGALEGKWVDLESSDVESTADAFTTTDETESTDEISEEDIDKLFEFITDEAVIKNAEFIDDQDIEGNPSMCIKMSWNKEELKEVLRRYAEIYDEEFDEEAVDESLKEIDYLEIESCIGKKSNQVHKIAFLLRGSSEGTSTTISLSLKLWDYNADIGITEPTDVYDLEELLQETVQEYSDYDYTGEEDFTLDTYFDVINQ